MNSSIDSYYEILGVTANTTGEEIKQAYRKKAKELHPDRNKHENAHEQFILLTEAYECLFILKKGRANSKPSAGNYTDWQQQSRNQARQRAREYAQMQYEEFKKTDYYKKTVAANIILEHFYFFSSILLLALPVIGVFFFGLDGLIVGLTLTFLSAHYWAGIFKDKTEINLRSFASSFALIASTRTFKSFAITLINTILFFLYTLNTQITFLLLCIILFGLYTLVFVLYNMKPSILRSFSKTSLFLWLIPSVFNLFFVINSVFSSNPSVEKYSFVHKEEWYGGIYSRERLEKTGFIYLENNAYSQYEWFRMFFNFEAMKDKQEITYVFEDGLFGLRVLKSYEFTK